MRKDVGLSHAGRLQMEFAKDTDSLYQQLKDVKKFAFLVSTLVRTHLTALFYLFGIWTHCGGSDPCSEALASGDFRFVISEALREVGDKTMGFEAQDTVSQMPKELKRHSHGKLSDPAWEAWQ